MTTNPRSVRALLPRVGLSLAVAVVAVVAFAAVLPGGKFVFDDHVLIETNTDLLHADVWWAAFTRDYYATSSRVGGSGYYRPLAVLTNAIDMRRSHANPRAFHVTNLVLHAAASLALVPALATLGAPPAVAWVTALVFAAHPAHAESVAFVSGRVDVLAALLMFLALALAGSRRPFAGTACGLAALGAFVSKEIAAVLPLLVLLVWTARPAAADAVSGTGASRREPPSGATLAIAIGIAALVALLLRRAALGAWLPASASGPRPEHAWLLPVRTLFFAIAALCAPRRRLTLEPDPMHLDPLWIGAGIAIAVGLWIAAWRADRDTRPVLRRCLWAGGLSLLPTLNLLPQETLLSERFLYVASGFWLVPAGVLAVAGWRRGAAFRPLTAGVVAVVLVLLLGFAAWRARSWRDDVIVWSIAVKEEPNRAAFWDRLGLSLTERREFAPAEAALRKAIALDPNYFNAQLNLGVMLHASRRAYDAIPAYRKAIELDPRHVNARLDLGLALLDTGDFPGAYEQFKTAVSLKPDDPDALRLAGGAAVQLGRLDEARPMLEAAQRLLPKHPGIREAMRYLEAKEKARALSPPAPPSHP